MTPSRQQQQIRRGRFGKGLLGLAVACCTLTVAAWSGCAAAPEPVPPEGLLPEVVSAVEPETASRSDSFQVAPLPDADDEEVCYIVTQEPGRADDVLRVPLSDNYTVLDAIVEIDDPSRAHNASVWVERTVPDEPHAPQILPVDWNAITQQGDTMTNYELNPNDRIHIEDRRNALSKFRDRLRSAIEDRISHTMSDPGLIECVQQLEAE